MRPWIVCRCCAGGISVYACVRVVCLAVSRRIECAVQMEASKTKPQRRLLAKRDYARRRRNEPTDRQTDVEGRSQRRRVTSITVIR